MTARRRREERRPARGSCLSSTQRWRLKRETRERGAFDSRWESRAAGVSDAASSGACSRPPAAAFVPRVCDRAALAGHGGARGNWTPESEAAELTRFVSSWVITSQRRLMPFPWQSVTLRAEATSIAREYQALTS